MAGSVHGSKRPKESLPPTTHVVVKAATPLNTVLGIPASLAKVVHEYQLGKWLGREGLEVHGVQDKTKYSCSNDDTPDKIFPTLPTLFLLRRDGPWHR